MRCQKKHPFDALFEQIEELIHDWQDEIAEECEEEEREIQGEEHPVIKYQYQKGVMTAFALLTNVVRQMDEQNNDDAWWMISNWVEANHRELGDCDTYLRALHASEDDAKDIYETAIARYDEFIKEMES